jgi:hypothetical protein
MKRRLKVMAKKKTEVKPDVLIGHSSSIATIQPMRIAVRDWIIENCPDIEGWQWHGEMLCIDWSCCNAIVKGCLL